MYIRENGIFTIDGRKNIVELENGGYSKVVTRSKERLEELPINKCYDFNKYSRSDKSCSVEDRLLSLVQLGNLEDMLRLASEANLCIVYSRYYRDTKTTEVNIYNRNRDSISLLLNKDGVSKDSNGSITYNFNKVAVDEFGDYIDLLDVRGVKVDLEIWHEVEQ